MSGKAYVDYTAGEQEYKVSLGTVVSVTPTISKRAQVTPIPSLDMQSAFPIELGNSKSYSIVFKRTNPAVPNNGSSDSDDWTNVKWYESLTNCINRWQVRTDGTWLEYSGDPYLPSFRVRGYIKTIERTYDNNFNEVISGTLTFTVGGMHIHPEALTRGEEEGESGSPLEYDISQMSLMMSDSNELNWYTLMYGQDTEDSTFNLIDSISVTGGPESPFEYATISISKRKLMEQIPALYGDIFATKNKLAMDVLSATGEPRRMFVTKVRTSGSSVTVTAYTEAWRYHNYSLASTLMGTPSFIIRSILRDPQYGVSYKSSCIIFDFDEDNDAQYMVMAPGTNIWRILQDCAICLGCRIWFADGCAFIVDLRRLADNDYATYYDAVDLYGSKYCIGTATIDEEGIDPVANSITIVCSSSEGGTLESICTNQESIDTYGELSAGTLNVMELVQVDDRMIEGESESQSESDIYTLSAVTGSKFGESYLSYLSEPQRSITFTFKELWYENGQRIWRPYFGCISQVDKIIDSYDKEEITNDSSIHDGKAYHKLAMSSYTRKYPQCTCEYSFGVIANIDLSSSTSQINSSLGSR